MQSVVAVVAFFAGLLFVDALLLGSSLDDGVIRRVADLDLDGAAAGVDVDDFIFDVVVE